MGCLKINNNYKGEIVKMSRYKNKRKGFSLKGPQLWELVKTNGGIITILLAVGTCIWGLANLLADMKQDIEELQTEVSAINTKIEDLQTEQESMYKYLYEDGGVKDQLGDIHKEMSQEAKVIIADENSAIVFDDISIKDNNISHTTSPFTAETVIGKDLNGNEYVAEELIGKTILLTYYDKEDDKIVYFLGQYNEEYHWDGYCVTNSYYTDGKFHGICESNFYDGERLDYETIMLKDKNKTEWGYYNRVCEGEKNIGVSIVYNLQYDKKLDVINENIKASDILCIDDFEINKNSKILTYYSGSTFNGEYNDDSGEAYLVEFYDDGTVDTLYVGNFVDGTFNDDTGAAWDIAYWEDGKGYMYNTGVFNDGNAAVSGKKVSKDEINEIIKGYKFDCELNWR